MVVPPKTPQEMIIFSRKTHGFVGETHHFRKPLRFISPFGWSPHQQAFRIAANDFPMDTVIESTLWRNLPRDVTCVKRKSQYPFMVGKNTFPKWWLEKKHICGLFFGFETDINLDLLVSWLEKGKTYSRNSGLLVICHGRR